MIAMCYSFRVGSVPAGDIKSIRMIELLPEQTHTTIGTWALAIEQAIQAKGLDPEPIFAKAGIDRADIKSPNMRVPVAKMWALWRYAAEAAQDDSLGLTAAKYVFPTNLSALLFALQASSTLREGVQRIVQYSKIVTTIGHVTTREEGGDLFLVLVTSANVAERPHEPVDALMATAVKTLRNLTGGAETGISEVRLMRPPPSHPDQYSEFLNCEVTFNADRDEIRLKGSVLDQPLPGANPELAAIQDQLLDDYLNRLDKENFCVRVKKQILLLLPSGELSQEKVAYALNMSTRNLHRKLADEDTTFKQLLDDIKKDLALRYLKAPRISIIELSYMLGFTDQSSFTRAFKRWTNSTPSQYREQLNGSN